MSSETKALKNQNNLNDDDVKHYLRQHPDFLERHIDLLDILIPPSASKDGVVDFQMILEVNVRLPQEIVLNRMIHSKRMECLNHGV